MLVALCQYLAVPVVLVCMSAKVVYPFESFAKVCFEFESKWKAVEYPVINTRLRVDPGAGAGRQRRNVTPVTNYATGVGLVTVR